MQSSWFRKRTLAVVAGLCGFYPLLARGQEALRNAVREDGAYQGRQRAARVEPEGWKAGPVYFQPSASFEMEWNDNVRNSEDKESDFILRPKVQARGSWMVTERSRVTFGVGVGYEAYLEHSELSRPFISPDSELAYDIQAKDWVFTLYDNFTYSQEVTSQASLSGIATLPRYDNTVGARATWTPGKGIFILGYSHQNYFTTESTNSFLDRTAEQVFLRAGYRFHPETSAGVEASGALTDFDAPVQRDNSTVTFGPYLEWQTRPWLWVKLRGSSVYYRPEATNSLDHADPQSSYYFSLDVDHQLTTQLKHALSVKHDFQPSYQQINSYTETTSFRYSAGWAMRENTSLAAYLLYEIGKEQGVGLSESHEDFDRLGFGLSVRQALTKKFSATAAYDWADRESNVPGRAYGQNRVTLTLNYVF